MFWRCVNWNGKNTSKPSGSNACRSVMFDNMWKNNKLLFFYYYAYVPRNNKIQGQWWVFNWEYSSSLSFISLLGFEFSSTYNFLKCILLKTWFFCLINKLKMFIFYLMLLYLILMLMLKRKLLRNKLLVFTLTFYLH